MYLIRKVFTLLALMTCGSSFAASLPVATSGLVTVYPGQRVQLNMVNLSDATKSCRFDTTFISTDGTAVPATPLSTILVGGESASSGSVIAIGPITLRASLDFTPQMIAQINLEDPLSGCYKLIPTLEVLDTTGTRVVMSHFVGMPNGNHGQKMTSVTLCHKPGTHSMQTKTLPIVSLGGHLGHGDTLGACH
jgi:hypothetical protein